MPKLKRLVALHFPASRLPDKLRGDIDPASRVTVTVEEKGAEGSEYETVVNDYSYLSHAEELETDP